VIDNVVKGFSPQDIKELANNIVPILAIIKEMTQPEVLNTVQNAMKALIVWKQKVFHPTLSGN